MYCLQIIITFTTIPNMLQLLEIRKVKVILKVKLQAKKYKITLITVFP